MFILLLSLFASLISSSNAEDEICGYFKYCGGASQSAARSMPSTSSSTAFNPSNVARIKGLGFEMLYQPNNPLGFSVVTGTGQVGAALVSSSMENSFFGNRTIEIDDVYLYRRIEKKRYKSKKINFAAGTRVIKKKNYALDLGLSLKRNPEIKKINPGFGISGNIYFLHFGMSIYKDDVKVALGNYINRQNGILYSSLYNSTDYQEDFIVRSYSIGTKIKNLTLDVGFISTQYNFYEDVTDIVIYSAAFNYNRLLFNLAYRHEQSSNMKEYQDGLIFDRNKKEYYGGIQYLINKRLTVGVAYNHFLVRDISTTLTLFF